MRPWISRSVLLVCIAILFGPGAHAQGGLPMHSDSIYSAIAAMPTLTEPGPAPHFSWTYGRAFADPDAAATPVEGRIRSFVGAFNRLSPDRWAQAEQLVQSHAANSALGDRVRRRRINFLLRAPNLLRERDVTGGYAIESIDTSSPTAATVQLKEKGAWGGRRSVRVEVQSEAPHKMTTFEPSPPRYRSSPEGDGNASLSEGGMVRRARQILDRAGEEGTLSGTVLIGRNGRPLLAEAYGPASRTYGVPNRVETTFSVASMGKMFTAVAIAQLVDDGKVALDDKLAEYVPDLPTPEAAQKIEIRHLLSHTSGMGNYWRAAEENPDAAPVDLIRGEPLQFEPGTKTRYSNAGFVALGEVIETVADTTYTGYLDEHVFGPAGMTDTYVRRPGNVHPEVATGYDKAYTETGTRFRRTSIGGSEGSPSGGANSTVLDLLRFATALQQGTLVDPEVLRTFTTRSELARGPYGYGFGARENDTIYGHNGGFPGVSALLEVYRESGFVVVVLGNRSGARIWQRVRGTMQGLIQRVR